MAYSHVLFDLDHTLLDTEASLRLAFDHTMSVAGRPCDASYSTFQAINQPLWRAVERGEHTPEQVHVLRFEHLVERLTLDVSPRALADAFADGMGAFGDLYHGARELLDHLHGRVRMAMITNGVSEIQRARIDRLDLSRYFDVITVSGEVQVAKPDPTIFDMTIAGLGDPDRTDVLMVGDNLRSDIGGGISAGLDACWYNPHGRPVGDGPQPTHTTKTLHAIAPLVLC